MENKISIAEQEKSIAVSDVNNGIAQSQKDKSTAVATGKRSYAEVEGPRSQAVAIGYKGRASAQLDSSIACAFGVKSKARGPVGSWLVLTEWKNKQLIEVRTFQIDGEVWQGNVYYELKDGKIRIADEEED